MKKLTGYIGAMIIVFALMGSILAGFALNINGQSTIINNYESVTDVSGLYTHTEEKAYIDYNPASNYIGYKEEIITYNSDVGQVAYKDLQDGESIKIKTTGEILINGISEGIPANGTTYLITNQFYIEKTGAGVLGITSVIGSNYSITTDIDITISGMNTTVSTTGFNVTFQIVYHNICYWNIDDTYNYYKIDGRLTGNNNDYNAYFKTSTDIFTLSYLSPGTMGNGDELLITQGAGYALIGNNATFGILPNDWITTNATVENGVYKVQVNYQPIYDNWDSVANPGYKTMSGVWIFYPRYVNTGGNIGITYTESNRVNNYLISSAPSNTTVTTGTIDLMNISATSYWPTNTGASCLYSKIVQGGQYGPDFVLSPGAPNAGIRNYKLSDILANYTIPANTKTIQINTNGTSYTTANMYYAGYSVNLDNNLVGFSNLNDYVDSSRVTYSDIFGEKDYLIYDLDRGIVDVYDYTGVKKYSNTPDKIMVCFTETGYTSAYVIYYVDLGGNITSVNPSLDFPNNRARPYLNITTTSVSPGYTHYMDISKGIEIDPTNINNVIWDNQYENGDIQLLFRASDTTQTYTNTINVSGNDIKIDYYNNRFYVTLNNNDPVDIGTWRNIVLDIDLKNSKLNVNPVRTFNSYTNVVLDSATIYVGDLTGATPTNIINWLPTAKSLMFNVYSTSVFMDSYGVVMVDPSLNITNYFTDLNNFYRLKLSNFSIYGDSITVNGITGTVSGNNLTIDDNTLMIKNLAITYADGHAYIEDSNISVDLGAITDNTITLNGVWYFETELLRGITDTKTIYDWDWSQFILDNTQFCIFYMGLALVGVIIARHFCILSITDYAVLVVSFIIALGVQVIA